MTPFALGSKALRGPRSLGPCVRVHVRGRFLCRGHPFSMRPHSGRRLSYGHHGSRRSFSFASTLLPGILSGRRRARHLRRRCRSAESPNLAHRGPPIGRSTCLAAVAVWSWNTVSFSSRKLCPSSDGSDPQSDVAQERIHDGPQYAFELSMFMCPAVHITTRS